MSLRIFRIDGKEAVFSKEGFKHLFIEKCSREKIKISHLEKRVAEQLGVADSTVHKWYYADGGPIDIETVKHLAEALDTQDITLLLEFINEGDYTMAQLSERQLSATKRVYDACIQFLHEFKQTGGFNDCWFDFEDAGVTDIETELLEMADGKVKNICLVLKQEYFDLRNCEIYTELWEFVNEDLRNTYDGKCSYGYRFEALADGNPTTEDDYNKAMIRLNTIVGKYI